MKKIYKVFQGTDKHGNTYYYAAHYSIPFCPIFGSASYKKSEAVRAAANRMCLSVAEYNSLRNV